MKNIYMLSLKLKEYIKKTISVSSCHEAAYNYIDLIERRILMRDSCMYPMMDDDGRLMTGAGPMMGGCPMMGHMMSPMMMGMHQMFMPTSPMMGGCPMMWQMMNPMMVGCPMMHPMMMGCPMMGGYPMAAPEAESPDEGKK